MLPRTLLMAMLCIAGGTPALSADLPSGVILYPRADSVVGGKVNLVLDPAADLSAMPLIQAVVNNKSGYPVIDTSTGKHASQGLVLEQGLNTITVRFIVPVKDENKRTTLKTVGTRDIRVFNSEGSFAGPPSGEFTRDPFHTREREADCTGCHRMEVTKEDADHKKPEDVLCYQCHKSIPTGRYIHGPAAVWNCIGCHNPEMSPVKYQFASIEPWQATKTVETAGPPLYLKTPAKPGLTVKGTCLKCHAEIAARTFKHGPADAGYCNLCHDPHASSQAAWLRKPAWDLCTTCHTDKASGVHVVAGFVAGKTHPTRFKPDPMRPGKRLTCASCHDPHGAESRDLFVYGARSSSDLCKKCHMKK